MSSCRIESLKKLFSLAQKANDANFSLNTLPLVFSLRKNIGHGLRPGRAPVLLSFGRACKRWFLLLSFCTPALCVFLSSWQPPAVVWPPLLLLSSSGCAREPCALWSVCVCVSTPVSKDFMANSRHFNLDNFVILSSSSSRGAVGIFEVTAQRRHFKFAVICNLDADCTYLL